MAATGLISTLIADTERRQGTTITVPTPCWAQGLWQQAQALNLPLSRLHCVNTPLRPHEAAGYILATGEVWLLLKDPRSRYSTHLLLHELAHAARMPTTALMRSRPSSLHYWVYDEQQTWQEAVILAHRLGWPEALTATEAIDYCQDIEVVRQRMERAACALGHGAYWAAAAAMALCPANDPTPWRTLPRHLVHPGVLRSQTHNSSAPENCPTTAPLTPDADESLQQALQRARLANDPAGPHDLPILHGQTMRLEHQDDLDLAITWCTRHLLEQPSGRLIMRVDCQTSAHHERRQRSWTLQIQAEPAPGQADCARLHRLTVIAPGTTPRVRTLQAAWLTWLESWMPACHTHTHLGMLRRTGA